MKTTGIYAIRHRESGKVYIGSSQGIEGRWRSHRHQLNRGDHSSPVLQNCWNRHGPDAFEFVIVEVCDIDKLIEREQFHIDAHGCIAPAGFNCAPVAGSRRGVPQPASVGVAVGNAHRGKPKSAEQRAKMSAAALGRKKSPEHIAAIAAGTRRAMQDPTLRQHLSDKAKEQYSSPEARAALSARATAQFADPAKRQALSDIKRAQYSGTEGDALRAKLSEAHKGAVVSDEVKAKMSATHKAAWSDERRAERSAANKARYSDPSELAAQRARMDIARQAAADSRRGNPLSEETRAKMSAAHLARSAARKTEP